MAAANDHHDGRIPRERNFRKRRAADGHRCLNKERHQFAIERVGRIDLQHRRRDRALGDIELPSTASPGRTVAPGTTLLTITTKKTISKMRSAFGTRGRTGKVTSTIGTAPRRPTQPMKSISRNGNLIGRRHAQSANGRATNPRKSATLSPIHATPRRASVKGRPTVAANSEDLHPYAERWKKKMH